MNKYVKPSIKLPVSLDDARISDTVLTFDSQSAEDGKFTLLFENGIKTVSGHRTSQTGKAAVTFSGIDFDLSYVLYYKENGVSKIEFENFAKDIRKYSCDIMEETYGNNVSKIICLMTDNETSWDAEIFIYHLKDTLYMWED